MLFTPGDLDRVLEGEKHALARPLVGRHVEQVAAEIGDAALGDLVALAAGEHRGERRLAGAVRPHDRVHLAGADRQVDPFQDLAAVFEPRVQVFDFEHQYPLYLRHPGDGRDHCPGHPLLPVPALQPASVDGRVATVDPGHDAGMAVRRRPHPTLPSRLTASSFCASTANSIGSSFRTSLQKPLTISDSASSSDRPRWRQ